GEGDEYRPVVRVATSHFESLDFSAGLRREQVALASSLLHHPSQLASESVQSHPAAAILCGDFNLCNDDEQDLPTQTGLTDAWLDTHPDDPGFTMNVTYPSKKYPPRRFDRIVYVPNERTRVVRALTFGEEAIPGLVGWYNGEEPVWPSDHLGVLAEFEVSV
ncbi:hypothetical protein HK104_010572, partial [Borealophlyctis nickersoniae]